MTIRTYQSADLDTLLTIFRKNVPHAFGAEEVAEYADFLERLPTPYVVAEHDGQVVGASGYYVSPDNQPSRIIWILSDPAAKGLGVGSTLMNHCLNAIWQEAPDRPVECRTSQVAYPFFERFGFRVQYTNPDYWVPGLDLHYMTKNWP